MSDMCPWPYLKHKVLPNGKGVWLQLLIMGNGRIVMGENDLRGSIEQFW